MSFIGKQDLVPIKIELGVIRSYSFPALNTTTLDNVSDSVLIHFL